MIKIGGQNIPQSTLFLVASESALIVLCLLTASAVRFVPGGGSVWGDFGAAGAMARFGLVVLVCDLALYFSDLYDLRVVSRRSVLLVRLLQALGTACFVLAVIYYLEPRLTLGRGIAILAAPAILAVILGWRLLLENDRFALRRPDRLLVVGTGPAGISLVREITDYPHFNMKVVGFLDEKRENVGKSLVNPGIIGTIDELRSMVVREKVSHVVLALKERRGHMPVRELLRLKFEGIRVEDAYTLYEQVTGRILLEGLAPSWLILAEGFRKSTFLRVTKRGMDVVISLLALLFCLPLMALAAVAIRLESGTPILFRQKRVGLRGKQFEMLKFRSMYQNGEQQEPAWAAEDDHRITRVGRFIRTYRIDELPQFFNVLRGEMSLVGPRPEQPFFCKMLEEKIPLFAERHTVRPGITGWAQIKYQYGASVEESKTKLEFDLFYIKHLSVMVDLVIIFETLKVVLLGRGAK